MTTNASFDVIVVGSGVAGLSTALFCALKGMRVLVLEQSQWIGGTSALSAGAVWIPGSQYDESIHARNDGSASMQTAAQYLEAATHAQSPAALRDAFLHQGPQAIKELTTHTAVQFRAFAYHPDYCGDLPGASTHGRALECPPFDGRLLQEDFLRLRPPIPEFTVLNGMMVDRTDIGHLLQMGRSWASLRYATGLLVRYAKDRLRFTRGTRLVMGNALVARLVYSLQQQKVPIWTNCTAKGLLTKQGDVHGLRIQKEANEITLSATKAVVMAGGGFNDHPDWRATSLPPCVRYTPRSQTSSGALLYETLRLGARLGSNQESNACWAPVSIHTRRDQSLAVFPHFVLDRGKPGTLIVNAQGKRFANECVSYHQLGQAMLSQSEGHAWLITDRQAIQKYGLGLVRPGGRGLKKFIQAGYLIHASTLDDLAKQAGIALSHLKDSIQRYNALASTGVDEDFARGSTPYQRNLGDASVQPNPNLRPLDDGAFFAIHLYTADIAGSRGLVTDAYGRVLRDQAPIAGLHAVGNDMHSIMGSHYPGPGINLGPAIAFAFAASQQIYESKSKRR
ncbi:FAD-dependent oxidoreductase [Lampropedia puyangensis]|uniref:FAD-dependent oxidoreductase n=1 Tax=Lampropedia puyangensis TaxID=1330072 RepID=A0A4S8EUE8_9BURK|nr:FAD-dependent oxidoreductase [Lampropedia puyangensis]THT98477.1 FAD-dependent oxidoreductase [Lampropedia puyangensis]